MGLVYQFFNLIPTLTVEKNITLPLRLDKRRPDPAALAAVGALGLQDKLQALPAPFPAGSSSGWPLPGRCATAPALLLADEPTGNLDRRDAGKILDLLGLCHRSYTAHPAGDP